MIIEHDIHGLRGVGNGDEMTTAVQHQGAQSNAWAWASKMSKAVEEEI